MNFFDDNYLKLLNKIYPDICSEKSQLLLDFLSYLYKFNQNHNFSSIEDKREFFLKNLIDCLTIKNCLIDGNALDIGTGPGLPGMPLAIINPSINWCLLDSRDKRTMFIQMSTTKLKLKNVTVVNSRIESFKPKQLFKNITSRAFSSLENFVDVSLPLLDKDGVLIAMKGNDINNELESIHTKVNVQKIISVPKIENIPDRKIVLLKHKG